MKKLTFALLFFSAIAWLWIGHMMGADGTLVNTSGTTTVGGSSSPGSYLTNNNVNTFVIFTNNQISLSISSVGVFTLTNYAAAGLGMSWSTNNNLTPGGRVQIRQFGQYLASDSGVFWGSATQFPTDQGDTGITRDSAGVVQVNSGAAGTLRDLKLRNLVMLTNYVAADFTPIANSVKIAVSNGVLFKVTQKTTNLLSQDIP